MCNVSSLKQKFQTISKLDGPPGNLNCPDNVWLAKKVTNDLKHKCEAKGDNNMPSSLEDKDEDNKSTSYDKDNNNGKNGNNNNSNNNNNNTNDYITNNYNNGYNNVDNDNTHNDTYNDNQDNNNTYTNNQDNKDEGFSVVIKWNNNKDNNLTDTFDNNDWLYIQYTFHYLKDKPDQCVKPPEVLGIVDKDNNVKADIDAVVLI